MKELSEIVEAFTALESRGVSAALATVIATEGSAYRSPGAKMLIAADGRTWGGVSGGCIERDVARRALGVFETGRPLICRYDPADEDEVPDGAATGCGGAVELFIQPLSKQAPGPIPFMDRVLRDRKPMRVMTVLSGSSLPAGTCVTESESIAHPAAEGARLFVESLHPPQALVVFGSGNDAVPLVTIAKTLGWHVTLVAAPPALDVPGRFPAIDALRVTGSGDPLAQVPIDADSAVVILTHNFARDAAILAALPRELRYLGLLGPRHRTRRMLDRLPPSLRPNDLHFPIGLDLGSRSPEEIALAVVAEILAVIRNAPGGSLCRRAGPIHRERPTQAYIAVLRDGSPDRSDDETAAVAAES